MHNGHQRLIAPEAVRHAAPLEIIRSRASRCSAVAAWPPWSPAMARAELPPAVTPACSRRRRRGAGAAPTPARRDRSSRATDLEAWLDGFMPYALEHTDVAGSVVVVVKDGKVLLQKGYGYSDLAKRTPVDPAAHAVPPGLGVQAVHLDRGDAAGRAGQARPRRRTSTSTSTSRSRRARRQAGHAAQHHDPHRGHGRGDPRADRRRREAIAPLDDDPEALGARTHLRRRAPRPRTPTTPRRSPATSSSACRASRSTSTSSSTSSRRWA